MKNSVTHIIKKQVFNINVPAGESSHSVQERLGRICRQTLPQALEQVCNALCAEDYWVKMDKIRLDLGTLPATGLETALTESTAEKLATALTKVIETEHSIPDTPHTRKKSPAAPVELLIYFLSTGVLPAWTDSRSVTAKQLFDDVLATAPDTLYRFLRQNSHKNKLAKRLAGILEYHQLKALASGFTKTTVFRTLIDTLQRSQQAATASGRERPLQQKEALLSYILHFDAAFPKGSLTKQGAINPAIAGQIKKGYVFKEDTSHHNNPAPPENPFEKDSASGTLPDGMETYEARGKTNKNQPESSLTPPEKMHTKVQNPVLDKDAPTRNDRDHEQRKKSLFGATAQSCTLYNAGLALLWPGIPSLLESCSLTEDHAFVDEAAAERAVLLLQYAVDSRIEVPEFELPLNKLLCGLAIDTPVATVFTPKASEKAAVRELLQAVIAEWPPLNDSSPEALQVNFLQRKGVLRPEGGHWQLDIERQTADVLLDRLPWGTGVIKLPWMQQILYTVW